MPKMADQEMIMESIFLQMVDRRPRQEYVRSFEEALWPANRNAEEDMDAEEEGEAEGAQEEEVATEMGPAIPVSSVWI